MTSQRRLLLIYLNLAAACLLVGAVAIWQLYRVTLETERNRLSTRARSYALLIQSMAPYNERDPSGIDSATVAISLGQIRNSRSQYETVQQSDEVDVGRREGDAVVLFIRHIQGEQATTDEVVGKNEPFTEPMRHALAGESGTQIGEDHHGNRVLSAYEPIPSLGLGVVAKINMREVRSPFIQAGAICAGLTVLVVFAGTYLIKQATFPIIKELEHEKKELIEEMQRHFETFEALRKAEADLRKLNEELEARVEERTAQLAEANRDLEAFSYTVSHDLRQPLRAIASFGHILEEEYEEKLGTEGKRLLGMVRENTRRMSSLIDDLLELSKLGRRGMELVRMDPAQMAREIFESLAPQWAGREIEFVAESMPSFEADPILMRQALENLISNAIKYTRGRQPATIRVGSHPENGHHVYYVKDNGAGFDMKYANKLFGVFERLHPSGEFEGTGVGLAIVHRVVQRHGGRVWAKAEPDKGATFLFTLHEDGQHGS